MRISVVGGVGTAGGRKGQPSIVYRFIACFVCVCVCVGVHLIYCSADERLSPSSGKGRRQVREFAFSVLPWCPTDNGTVVPPVVRIVYDVGGINLFGCRVVNMLYFVLACISVVGVGTMGRGKTRKSLRPATVSLPVFVYCVCQFPLKLPWTVFPVPPPTVAPLGPPHLLRLWLQLNHRQCR